MPSNEVVILNQVLGEKHADIGPELSESEFFEAFSAEQVLKDRDMSWDDIESGRLGGGGDGGLDACYLFVNGHHIREDTDPSVFKGTIEIEMVLVQAKRSSGFQESPVQAIASSLTDLLDLSADLDALSATYNEDVIEFFSRFQEVFRALGSKLPSLKISVAYVTKGVEPHPNTERLRERVRTAVAAQFRDADFAFNFIGALELLELVRRRPRTTFSLPFREDVSGSGGNVALVGLKEFADFIRTDTGALNKALFDANVRDHQGDVSVNKAIRKSLTQPGAEDFWWLNNGVTILASEVTAASKVYTIEDPQIVNGLQTSFEIFHYFSAMEEEATDDRSLLVRLITPSESESHEKIIRATNSQTTIPFASLKATDKIHRNLEDFLHPRGLYYERRKNFYKNEGRPLATIVTIPYLAQATMSLLLNRPNDARARPTTLLKRPEDYERIFNQDYPLEMYEKITRIQKASEVFLRAHDSGLAAKEVNNLRFYVSYFALRTILEGSDPRPQAVADADLDALTDELLENALKAVLTDLDAEGGDDKAAKSASMAERVISRF